MDLCGQVWYLIVSIPDLCTLTYFGRLLYYNNISNAHNSCCLADFFLYAGVKYITQKV